MASVVRREKHERTAFGKLIKWAFIGFNILMVIWIVGGLGAASNIEVHSKAEEVGRAIGSAIGVASLLTLWAVGDVILGVLVALTRGDKVTTEEVVGDGFASDVMAGKSDGNYSSADALIAQFKAKKDMPPQTYSTQTKTAATFGKRN
jgi:hypothetical protein